MMGWTPPANIIAATMKRPHRPDYGAAAITQRKCLREESRYALWGDSTASWVGPIVLTDEKAG